MCGHQNPGSGTASGSASGSAFESISRSNAGSGSAVNHCGSATLLSASGAQNISSKGKKFLMILFGRQESKKDQLKRNKVKAFFMFFYVSAGFLFRGM
jgi:hypothetical protein